MRILLLSTYPAANPIHGGQHRLNNIRIALEQAGHEVHTRGVLGSESYDLRTGYVRYPGYDKLRTYIADPTLMEDWAIGAYAADPAGGYKALAQLCSSTYDLVFCEQPWLFGFAHKLFGNLRKRPVLVYGSQNVEGHLKHEILRQYLPEKAESGAALVREAELFAATNADLLVAVSEHDRDWLSSVSDKPIIVAANGVADRRASLDDVRLSNALTGNRKFALYCASGHPPNIQGFFDVFGNGIGCLSPGQRLVVAGGAGPSITADPRCGRASALPAKLISSGPVTEAQLRGLLATAHVIILPITKGGGTNLKTAEALWSGRHVVGTSTAMRGFERFTSSRGVQIADDPAAFQTAIRKAMDLPALQLTAEERQDRSTVLWGTTLAPLVMGIQSQGPRHG